LKRTLVKSININADFDNAHDFTSFLSGVRWVLYFGKPAVKLIPAAREKESRTGRKIKCGYVMGDWVRRYKPETFPAEYQARAVLSIGKSFKSTL
jgi:hypothetical protein